MMRKRKFGNTAKIQENCANLDVQELRRLEENTILSDVNRMLLIYFL